MIGNAFLLIKGFTVGIRDCIATKESEINDAILLKILEN